MSKVKREISLAKLDESYKNTVAYQYGLFAEKFSYDMLPESLHINALRADEER